MAPKSEEMWMVVIEQGAKAEATLDAIDGMIDSMTKTTVISHCRLVSWGEMTEEQLHIDHNFLDSRGSDLTCLNRGFVSRRCVSANGKYLNSMIIWPAATHRANWVTHPTPGWHYAYSDSGYTDSYISLQWLKLVFDTQTKQRANQKSRVLIYDGFGTHETLEILEFCFENNIILCRLPSHTSYKLQPCDISMFGPLKAAYRDQVERLERGCVGTIGKEHFTYLYSPARNQALTSKNIRAGWVKAGLFPFNPDKVLSDIPKPPAKLTAPKTNEVGSYTQD
jgi:hypothetical protein